MEARTSVTAKPPRRRPSKPIDADTSPADRLTARDGQILRLLAEHRMLTIGQITTALFTDLRKSRPRVADLRALGLVETFRPPRTSGTSQMHCVATPKALRLIADSVDGAALRGRTRAGRSDAATAIALRPDLAHLRGVNELFCRLLGRARRDPECALADWLSEWTVARTLGGNVRPDGFGRWTEGEAWCEFFLEYDTGTEPQHRLISKLAGYADLADAADVSCPVLFWLQGPEREDNLHRRLAEAASGVPVATASGDPAAADPSGPVWRPAWGGQRLDLACLGAAAARSLGVRQRPHTLI